MSRGAGQRARTWARTGAPTEVHTGAPLRIALLAHVRHPIAAPFMGGMEAHAWHLARGLAARGHEVTLFASGDSDAPGALWPVLPEHYDRRWPWHDFHGTDALNRVLDAAHAEALPALAGGGFDVVHNNGLHRYPPRMARRDRMPTVTSLHVPPFDALHRAVMGSAAPWSRFTTCSERQRRAWWPDGAPPEAHVVPNGIDLADWPFAPAPGEGAVWAGRITPNKGAHVALEAARVAGVPLTLYGQIEDRAYYEEKVRPLLTREHVHAGHVGGAELAAAYRAAAAMLFTPHWDEPFGLAAVEAMACGLPVAATDMGAVREVIGPAGRFALPDRPDMLAGALLRAISIPRTVPRERVEALFTLERMIDGYEIAYRRAIAGREAPAPEARFAPHELPPRVEVQQEESALRHPPRAASPAPALAAE